MDNHLVKQQQDALIEDTLKNHPLATMPHSITADVMRRVQKDVRPVLVTWNDFVVSLAIVLCIGALFFTLHSLPPIILVRLHIQEILLHQNILVDSYFLLPMLAVAGGISLATLMLYQLLEPQPQ